MQDTYSIVIEELALTDRKFIDYILKTKNWSRDEAIQKYILKSIQSGYVNITLKHTQENNSI
tara:strand:+ start:842 stop:1027 length:186 start_codon:yes stop_codon:yes gene_type:complete